MNRREFLLSSVGAASLILLPFIAQAENAQHSHKNKYLVTDEFWNKPRKLKLKRQQTGEALDLVYWEGGNLNYGNYKKVCYLLRDVQQDSFHEIDIKLLNLLCGVQAWLKSYGHEEGLLVHSGYRTKNTNRNTEGSAKNSFHIQGKAVDFSIENLSATKIIQLAKDFQAGGVGFYPNREFIHLDTGDVRYWKY